MAEKVPESLLATRVRVLERGWLSKTGLCRLLDGFVSSRGDARDGGDSDRASLLFLERRFLARVMSTTMMVDIEVMIKQRIRTERDRIN